MNFHFIRYLWNLCVLYLPANSCDVIMLLDHWVVSLIHLLLDVSNPKSEHPRDSGSARGDQSPALNGLSGFQLLSLRLIHSQQDALSAVCAMRLMACFLTLPWTPRAPNIFQHDFDQNPLAPTSIGKHHVLYPCSLHCSTRSAYFADFLS